MTRSQLFSAALAETEAIGTKLAARLRRGGVLALEGDLGGGKTVIVKGLGRALGIKQRILSPTFTIYRSYQIPNSRKWLHHFDFYRLPEVDADLRRELIERIGAGDIVAIEWAGAVEDILPADRIKITIHNLGQSERRLDIEGVKP